MLLTFQNNAPVSGIMPGLRVSRVRTGTTPARFDLSVIVGEGRDGQGLPSGLGGQLIAAADLFDRAAAVGMAVRFVRVLSAVAADPAVRLRQLEVLDRAERMRVLEEWNATTADVEPGSVAERIVARAARVPDAVAVCCGDAWVSYGVLVERAARLGGYLRAAGAGPESVVALCLDRGAEMVTAMLGVWLAGAAYLPLDRGVSGGAAGVHAGRQPGGAGRRVGGGFGGVAGGAGAGGGAG